MEKVEVVVVGGGLAGLATACVLAEAGVEVLVVERGDYSGSKNVTGGRLYLEPVRPYPARPVGRRPVRAARGQGAPDDDGAGVFAHRRAEQPPLPPGAAVQRDRAARHLRPVAGREGGGEGRHRHPRLQGGRPADGRRPGGRHPLQPTPRCRPTSSSPPTGFSPSSPKRPGCASGTTRSKVAVGVKEVIELPEEKIQDRFGLQAGTRARRSSSSARSPRACSAAAFCTPTASSLSLGLVLGTHALMEKKPPVQPHDLMEAFKARPEVEALIAGGQPVEYSAHTIPEGGLRAMSRLVADGMVVVGDAAGLALNQGVTVRGMDLALVSGALAGAGDPAGAGDEATTARPRSPRTSRRSRPARSTRTSPRSSTCRRCSPTRACSRNTRKWPATCSSRSCGSARSPRRRCPAPSCGRCGKFIRPRVHRRPVEDEEDIAAALKWRGRESDELLNIEAKLGLDVFQVDGEQPHIVVNHEVCQTRCTVRYCLHVCPANLYSLDEARSGPGELRGLPGMRHLLDRLPGRRR